VIGGTLRVWTMTFGSRVLTTGAVMLNFLVVARGLGPADSGDYFVFLTTVLFASVVVELGLSQSAAVFAARYPGAVGYIHATALKSILAVSAAAAAIFLVLPDRMQNLILPSPSALMVGLACVAVPFAAYANVWNSLAVGLQRVVTANLVQFAMAAIAIVLNLIVIVWLKRGTTGAVLVYVGLLVLQALVMGVLAARLRMSTPPSPTPHGLSSELMQFGVRGYPGALSSLLWQRAAVFLLNATHGPAPVAIFSIGQQLAEKMLLPAQVMKEVIHREIVAASPAGAAERTNHYLRLTLGALGPLIVLVAVVAPPLISFAFGPAFRDAADVFRILAVGSLLTVVSLVVTPYFLGQLGRPGLLSALAWVNVVVGCGLMFLLIPGWRQLGAAVSVASAQVFGAVVLLVLYRRGVALRGGGPKFASPPSTAAGLPR
jgi:O-antigen/teichoic acid export membrane protein